MQLDKALRLGAYYSHTLKSISMREMMILFSADSGGRNRVREGNRDYLNLGYMNGRYIEK